MLIELSDVKRHLIAEHDDDDALIESYVTAAAALIEARTDRKLSPGSVTATLDRFPSGRQPIELRTCPVQSVDSIEYIDENGDTQELSDYIADTVSEPARIVPAWDTCWPTTRCQPGAVTVTHTAGYDEIPETARQAILLIVGHWYAHREAVGQSQSELPLAVAALTWGLKWTL